MFFFFPIDGVIPPPASYATPSEPSEDLPQKARQTLPPRDSSKATRRQPPSSIPSATYGWSNIRSPAWTYSMTAGMQSLFLPWYCIAYAFFRYICNCTGICTMYWYVYIKIGYMSLQQQFLKIPSTRCANTFSLKRQLQILHIDNITVYFLWNDNYTPKLILQ